MKTEKASGKAARLSAKVRRVPGKAAQASAKGRRVPGRKQASAKGGHVPGKAAQASAKGGKVSGKAELELFFSSAPSAKAAYHALLQEADFSHRGGSKVELKGKSVKVSIKGDDIVSIRASLNSYLRLMHIIKTVETDIGEGGR